MRLATCAAIAALSVAVPAFSQAAEPTFSPDRVRGHVEFLADDLLEGRDAGTRGYDLAAKYVATQFDALGLTPAGTNGGWYQQVPLQESNLAKGAPARLTVGGKSFANGSDVLFAPSAREDSQVVEAPVVFVGYGMDAPEQGIDDYKGLDVRGKIIATLSGFPKGMASDIGAHLASQKAKTAERHGAIGTISILTPTALRSFSWERRSAYADEPAYTWIETDGKPFVEAPGIRFGASLNRPAAEALFAGAPRPLAAVIAESEKKGGGPRASR